MRNIPTTLLISLFAVGCNSAIDDMDPANSITGTQDGITVTTTFWQSSDGGLIETELSDQNDELLWVSDSVLVSYGDMAAEDLVPFGEMHYISYQNSDGVPYGQFECTTATFGWLNKMKEHSRCVGYNGETACYRLELEMDLAAGTMQRECGSPMAWEL